MTKTKAFFIAIALSALPALSFAGVKAIVSVSNDGLVSLKGAEIVQIIGPTLIAKTAWDEAYIRWIIRTDNGGDIKRMFGGTSGVTEMKIGHILNIEGKLMAGADSLNVVARNIVNLSLENEDNQVFSGTISEIYPGNSGAELKTKNGAIALKISSSLSIPKGKRFITVADLRKGDRVLSAKGTYHPPTKTLTVESIEIYQDTFIFWPRNFEGKLKSLTATTLPTTAVITSEGKDYTVYLPVKAEILNNKRKTTTLARFVIGDAVRFYGAIRQTDLSVVDAEVIRNLDL